MPASKCPNCDEWVTDWMTTCLSCGYVLRPEPPQQPTQPPVLPPAQLPPAQLPPAQLPPAQLPPAQLPPAQLPPVPQQPPAGWSYPPQPPVQPPYAAGFPPPKRGRGRLWAALAGALVLVLAAGGALFFVLRGGSDHHAPAASEQLRPVTSKPTQRWAWSSDKNILSVSADGNLVVATLTNGAGIVALDGSGHELWRNDSEKFDYVYLLPGDHLIDAGYADSSTSGTIIFDSTGKQLWRGGPGDYFNGKEDDGSYLVSVGTHVEKIDPTTKKILWSIPEGDDWQVEGHRVLTLSGDTVTSYSRTDAAKQWTATLPPGNEAGMTGKYEFELSANDTFVLVSTGTLTALDVNSGKQLWSEGKGGSLIPTAGGRFLVVPPYYYNVNEKQPTGSFPLYSSEGRAGSMDVTETDGVADIFREKIGGRELNVAVDDGKVLDEDGKVVDQGYADMYEPFADGFYTLTKSTVGYRRWHQDKADWSLTLSHVDSVHDEDPTEDYDIGVNALDGALIINDKRTIWRYE